MFERAKLSLYCFANHPIVLCVAFVDGEDPDQDYIDAALPIIEEHMMLGAHRLAALMVDIYGSSERAANFITQ